MQTKAIEKLRSEMTQNTANSYIQVVGGFLLQHLESNPQDAEKILVADKTISKSLEEMRKAAEKKRFGNCAVLTDPEGFAVVLKYFGIEADAPIAAPVARTSDIFNRSNPPSVAEKQTIDFDIKLEDLI